MPRALIVQHAEARAGERAEFLERVRDRKAYFAGESCRYWVFEDTALPGAFVEFVEAADDSRLRAAVAAAPGQWRENPRVYAEVES